jgi:F-type H+-transporting ATPase subunit b
LFTFEPGVALWTVITFGLVLWIIQSKVYPPVRKLLDTRRETIATALATAEQKEQEASRVIQELTERMQSIKLEEQRILSEAREKSQALYEQQAKEIMAELRELRKQKEKDLHLMEDAFWERSEQKLAKIVVASCEKILKTNLTAAQQREIIAERIQELSKIKEL